MDIVNIEFPNIVPSSSLVHTICSAITPVPTIAQSHNHTIAQSHNHTIAQSHNHTIAQSHNHTITQSHNALNQEDLAFILVKLLFTEEELMNENISGSCGYSKLDEVKIKWIIEFGFLSAGRRNHVMEKDFFFNAN